MNTPPIPSHPTKSDIENVLDIKFEDLGYRQAVQVVVLNANNEIAIISKHSYKEDEWSFPGGGVDEGEDLLVAAHREVEEELGLTDLEVVGRSEFVDKFDWPLVNIIRHFYQKDGEKFMGQEKPIYLMRLNSDQAIKVQEEEITKFLWVKPADLSQYMNFPGQRELYDKVLKEFKLI